MTLLRDRCFTVLSSVATAHIAVKSTRQLKMNKWRVFSAWSANAPIASSSNAIVASASP